MNIPKKALHASRGFTLVEMVVVLAIIMLISTIVLTGQSTFNRTLLLTDTAYTVAFSARQAQTYGLSSKAYGSVQNAGYGLRFNSATPNSYIFFADTARSIPPPPSGQCPLGVPGTPEEKPGNCLYDPGADGLVNTYTFNRGFTISGFCGSSNGARVCTAGGGLTTLDVVYTRPNIVATITGRVGGAPLSFSCAEIYITEPGGVDSRTVRLSQLGEVSLNQSCP